MTARHRLWTLWYWLKVWLKVWQWPDRWRMRRCPCCPQARRHLGIFGGVQVAICERCSAVTFRRGSEWLNSFADLKEAFDDESWEAAYAAIKEAR